MGIFIFTKDNNIKHHHLISQGFFFS